MLTIEFKQERLVQYARILLVIFLVLLVYDGALRKWLFQSGERIIFILKDVALVSALLLIMMTRHRALIMSVSRLVAIPVAVYVIYVVAELLNPRLPNLWVGLWGVKSHLLYASLIAILPATVNLKDLYEGLRKVYPWLVVPVCLIAFIQVYSPADSVINNPVRGGLFYVSNLGADLVRATGTFSYISGFTWFLQAALLLGFALLVIETKSLSRVGAPLLLLVLAVPTNGSRSVVVIVAVSVAIMLWGFLFAKLLNPKAALKYLAVLGGLGLIGYLLLPGTWGALVDRFLHSHVVAGDSARYYSAFTNAFAFFGLSGWFGFGPGSASQAAPFLVPGIEPFSWLPVGIGALGFEEESGKLVVELGIVGWIISLAFRIALCVLALRMAFIGKTRAIKGAAILALPVMALGAYMGSGIFAPPVGAAFYWFCVALLVMACKEDQTAADSHGRERSAF